MQILIINLPRSVERLDFQKKQFAQRKLSFQTLSAVSVDDISEQQYQQQGFCWQRPLRKVELACFLSHKSAWEKVIELNQPCLILEDDAVLANNSQEILEAIERKKLDTIDLINLEVRSRKKIISKYEKYEILNDKFKLFELYQDRTGAAGYILYPNGAKKLLQRLELTSPAIADGFICASYELTSLQIEPAVVIQQDQLEAYGLVDPMHLTSTIGRSEDHKAIYHHLFEKLKFRKRRIGAQLLMALRYLQVMPKATKRFISLNKSYFD